MQTQIPKETQCQPAATHRDKSSPLPLSIFLPAPVTVGSRVFYRKVPVGEVTSYKLGKNGQFVQVRIFVEAPYDQYVYKETNFWNSSGLSIEFNAKGISLQMESVSSLLWGGISFDMPTLSTASGRAASEAIFPLFSSKQSVLEGDYTVEYPYELHFSNSIRGLEIGAPVEFKGINIGRVTTIKLAHEESSNKDVEVTIVIQPERFAPYIALDFKQLNEILARLIREQGMRAQLKTGSFLTGALFVDLALEASDKPADLILSEGVAVLPTADNQFEQITKIVSDLMNRIDQVPIDQIGDDIARLAASLRKTFEALEGESFGEAAGQLVKNLNNASVHLEELLITTELTIKQAEASLAVIEPDTPLYEELIEMLRDVSEAAESIELLTDELGRNPQSLIYGNKNPENE